MKWNLIVSICTVSCLLLQQLPAVDNACSCDISELKKTSKAFVMVGKKALPAVVFIKAQTTASVFANNPSLEDYDNPFDYFSDEFFRRFFGSTPKGQPIPQITGGSGCIVSPDGYILTNNHVIKDANQITIVLNSGEEYEAKVIGTDPRTDLAVLKIEAKNLPYLSFGNSDELEVGEWVIAIGSPFTLQATLTVGVVSAKGRQNLKITDLEDFIQTDAAINPGNSGGALLDLDGNIVGINTAIASPSGGYMGVGFAIPSNMAKHVMNQIISNGSVKRGFIGVQLQSVDKEIAEALGLEKSEGLAVTEVVPGSAGDKAGLQQGDIIIALNGSAVKSGGSFKNEIALMEPGQEITLKVIRKNETKEIKLTLDKAPEETISAEAFSLGIEVQELKDVAPDILKNFGYSKDSEGVMIAKIKRGSLGERAGLKPGMLILQINQKPVKNQKDFQEAMQSSKDKKHLLLLVRFQGVTHFITIKVS